MIVRVSECGSLSWRSGALVWDDPLHHRSSRDRPQPRDRALVRGLAPARGRGRARRSVISRSPGACSRRACSSPRTRRSTAARRPSSRLGRMGSCDAPEPLCRAPRPPARSSATTVDGLLDQSARALEVQPPAIASERGGRRLGLPGVDADDAAWRHPGLVAALSARRSVRRFTDEPWPSRTSPPSCISRPACSASSTSSAPGPGVHDEPRGGRAASDRALRPRPTGQRAGAGHLPLRGHHGRARAARRRRSADRLTARLRRSGVGGRQPGDAYPHRGAGPQPMALRRAPRLSATSSSDSGT